MTSVNKSLEFQNISDKNKKFISNKSKSLKVDKDSTNSKEDWKKFYDKANKKVDQRIR